MGDTLYFLLRRLRSPLITLILIYSIAIAGYVLIPGEDDQGSVWHMSFFHAFYFVSYMASTIGFGEIPYAFTESQRLWTMLTIYATVIGWLYSIGSLLAVLQDSQLKSLRRRSTFKSQVSRLSSDFYLICGYGDTGNILVNALAGDGVQTVVIDRDEQRMLTMEISGFVQPPLGIVGEVGNAELLKMAGICSPHCKAVIALTSSDATNLQVTLTAHLLNPKLRVLVRAENRDAANNITSFGRGKHEVLNHFESFAGRLALALRSPSLYVLFEWMTGVPHEHLHEPLFPKPGLWIVCGYGRFGQALYDRLQNTGMELCVIEEFAEHIDAELPDPHIKGSAVVADTLRQAGIKHATGIIAGTHIDADNLSILLTAKELNEELFTVGRQNSQSNDILFEQANLDLLMKRGPVLAHRIFALLRTPLIQDFLDLAIDQSNEWANITISRIIGVTTEETPYLWEISLTPKGAPEAYKVLHQLKSVAIRDLRRHPYQRDTLLRAMPLMVKRNQESILMPEPEFQVKAGDRILMCATYQTHRRMLWALYDKHLAEYVLANKHHSLGVFSFFNKKQYDVT